jgi:hypothetical protein
MSQENKTDRPIKVGDKICYNVAPAWLFVGECVEVDDYCFKMKNSTFIQNVDQSFTLAIQDPKYLTKGNLVEGLHTVSWNAYLQHWPASEKVINHLIKNIVAGVK